MRETVLPLEMILFQVLFLLVAIALEARILYLNLRISCKTSVEYAMSLNLLATGVGWLTFFAIVNFLPQLAKAQVISYIFFDHLFPNQIIQGYSLIISVGIGIFFFTFFLKLIGIELLQGLLEVELLQSTAQPLMVSRRPGLINRIEPTTTSSQTKRALVILVANAYSFSAILIILFFRFLQFNSFP